MVASQRQAPPPGLEESARTAPSQAELPGPEGQGFRFLADQPGSAQPVTWSPCRPVHYVLRPDNAPVDGAAMIAQAVAAVSTATGLRFVADGPTSEGPSEDRSAYQPDLYGDRWSPVLIAWATPDEVPDFGVDIAGEAGPSGVTTPSGDTTYVSGIVYLDGAQLGEISASSGVAAATSVVTHELGHLVGLAHVNDPGQLMYPRGGSQVHYGAGEPCRPGGPRPRSLPTRHLIKPSASVGCPALVPAARAHPTQGMTRGDPRPVQRAHLLEMSGRVAARTPDQNGRFCFSAAGRQRASRDDRAAAEGDAEQSGASGRLRRRPLIKPGLGGTCG